MLHRVATETSGAGGLGPVGGPSLVQVGSPPDQWILCDIVLPVAGGAAPLPASAPTQHVRLVLPWQRASGIGRTGGAWLAVRHLAWRKEAARAINLRRDKKHGRGLPTIRSRATIPPVVDERVGQELP